MLKQRPLRMVKKVPDIEMHANLSQDADSFEVMLPIHVRKQIQKERSRITEQDLLLGLGTSSRCARRLQDVRASESNHKQNSALHDVEQDSI